MKRKHEPRFKRIKLEDYEYWKHPPKGYPKTIWWNVIAGPSNLSMLQDHDVIFDAYDLKIRKIEKVNKRT